MLKGIKRVIDIAWKALVCLQQLPCKALRTVLYELDLAQLTATLIESEEMYKQLDMV